MRKTLQRVIFLAFFVTIVSAGFWGWQNEAKPQKAKAQQQEGDGDGVEGPEVAGSNVDNAQVQQETAQQQQRERRNKKQKATPNAEKLKIRRKFQSTNPDKLTTEDFKNVIEKEVFDDTSGAEDAEGISDIAITKLWQEHMHDFVPEDMINFILGDQQHTVLCETIGHTQPTTIKGAYYVKGGNASKVVSVIVMDPLKQIVYIRKKAPQHIILFDTSVPGEYTFIFGNFYSGQEIVITMALHTYEIRKEEPIEYDLDEAGNRIFRGANNKSVTEAEQAAIDAVADQKEAEEPAKKPESDLFTEQGIAKAATSDDIGQVRTIMRNVQTSIKQIQTEAKMSLMRQGGHNQDLLENTNWSMFSILIEASIFIGILAFQLHHVKKSLDNKLIL